MTSRPTTRPWTTAATMLLLLVRVAGFSPTAPLRPPRTASPRAQTRRAAAPPASDLDIIPPSRIRNFCIIAHIDHGKSTLADRLLEHTGTVAGRDMSAQLLDSMDIEQERGITIKLNTARMDYVAKDGETYALNLIDTPGHVDFAYEVSRSLAACEGALLVVDASQGVEAQTLANTYMAVDGDLEVVPILNKIDLPAADCERVAEEIEQTIGLDCTDALMVSAKSGIGIEDVLEAIVARIPPPPGPTSADAPLRALIYDSYFDAYRGVIVSFRVVDGELRRGDRVHFLASGKNFDAIEVGVTTPAQKPVEVLRTGEVGYMAAGIKGIDDARVGDTITLKKYADEKAVEPLPGYSEASPMVYCGLFPTDANQYNDMRDSLGKLKLNDAALSFEPEVSTAMGFGFRCGFLGLLHMEIVQERLEREYDLDLIVTAPTVVYEVTTNTGGKLMVSNPAKMPEAHGMAKPGEESRASVAEPYVRLEVLAPSEYTGSVMELCQSRRGELIDMSYVTSTRTSCKYDLPLAEVITDFFDSLKSRTKGYASMEYTITGYRENPLVRLDVRINGEDAPPLACIVHRDDAHTTGKALTSKLKELIPRQMFRVPIQACIGAKVVASSSISAMSKDVLAKCYGGDITRKKKLLNKQAKGKKRMKEMGKVSVPQEAFMAVVNIKREGS